MAGGNRSWRVPVLGTTALVLLLLLWPATAEAVGGGRASLDFAFQARGPAGEGYTFDFSASGERPGRSDGFGISINSALRSGRRAAFASTFYTSLRRSKVSRRRIRGRFGSRGRVGLRFIPKRTSVRRLFKGSPCKARETVSRGVLRGHLRFRGEGRYTTIKLKRLRAKRRTFSFGNCRSAPEERRPAPAILESCTDAGAAMFAVADRRLGRLVFAAPPPAARGGLLTFGFAAVEAGRSAFSYAKDLSRAKLDPGLPFRGDATYANELLDGSLRVRTPGSSTTLLAPAAASLTLDPDDGQECDSGAFVVRAAENSPGSRLEVRPPNPGAFGAPPTFAMRCERGRGCKPRPPTLP